MKDGDITKEYTAICENPFENITGTIDAAIARKEGSTIERIISDDGQKAITNYIVIDNKKEHALVRLCLQTGRTHQIRVHMKHIGHPLVGDYIYNPDNTKLNRQALHCSKLAFTHPISGKALEFTSNLPDDMANLYASLA